MGEVKGVVRIMRLAILLLEGWREDAETMCEVDYAIDNGIPIFGHIGALAQWVKDPQSLADGKKPSHRTQTAREVIEIVCCGEKPDGLCKVCHSAACECNKGEK